MSTRIHCKADSISGLEKYDFYHHHHQQQQPLFLSNYQYKMNILFVYPTFVLLLIHFIINANCTNHEPFWKRAREGSIDLNRTPSPDRSIESTKASPATVQIENTTSTKTMQPKKRKRNARSYKELKDAYNRRDELYQFEEQKQAIEKEYYQAHERIKRNRSRYRKNVWQRIRTGTARESDLRIRQNNLKSSKKWQKANREKMNAYQRKYEAKKKQRQRSSNKEK